MKINAIIVDDEINARENLRFLLTDFCKNVEILGEASNVDEAVLLIHKNKPDIVFLDIQMPRKNGFQLIREFDEINFQIIFVTAYDNYALKAFQIAALDYLLKPIDITLLTKSIAKAQNNINNKTSINRVNVLEENYKKITKIAIPYKSDYAIVNLEDICCIQADRMYSIIHLQNDKKYIVSKKLSYYESLLSENKEFMRSHRSWILNMNKISTYSKKNKEATLITGIQVPISKSYKDKFEDFLYSN